MTFGVVRVGVRSGPRGAAVVRGTSRAVTFAGRGSVTIASGGTVRSDRIALRVSRLRDLAVSVHVPTPTVPPLHPQTYVTQYVTRAGAGDRTADASGGAFPVVQEPIHWLDAVDVLTSARRAIVAIGDSITDGEQGPSYTDDIGMDRYPTWPDALARRIAATPGLPPAAVVNEGVNGDSLQGFPGRTVGLEERLGHDVLDLAGVTDVVLEIGTNDLSLGKTSAEVIRGLRRVVRRLHRHHLRVLGATLVPRAGSVFDSPAATAARAQVNRFIRTSRIFRGVLDIARVLGQPGRDNVYRPAYDSGDHLHPNTAGNRAIARSLRVSSLSRAAPGRRR